MQYFEYRSSKKKRLLYSLKWSSVLFLDEGSHFGQISKPDAYLESFAKKLN